MKGIFRFDLAVLTAMGNVAVRDGVVPAVEKDRLATVLHFDFGDGNFFSLYVAAVAGSPVTLIKGTLMVVMGIGEAAVIENEIIRAAGEEELPELKVFRAHTVEVGHEHEFKLPHMAGIELSQLEQQGGGIADLAMVIRQAIGLLANSDKMALVA